MQEKLQGTENTRAVTERRACQRFRVTSLMYIDIGNVNGGIVTSLSESGLALTAATVLGNGELGSGPLRMRIQFPGIPEAIEASGEVVWTSSSGKEARVRFVEIGETEHEQIRRWISNQASSNGLRPELPQLPKMHLPSSRRAKPGMPRYSFADVASSRVDAESEAGVEDFPEISRQPGAPPLQAGSNVFRDGKEVVASAFESPAFTEYQTRNTGSRNEQTTLPTPEEQPRQPTSPAIPERRQHSRRPVLLFTYAVLGEDNGGLVFDLSEGGLALTAAASLQEHHFNKMRVRFPDSEDWIETSGRLVWKSDSGREVGIEFVGLPSNARLRIREWVSQEEPVGNLYSGGGEARTSQTPAQELPSYMEPDRSSALPIETPASFEGQPVENQAFEEHRFENRARTPAASSSALFKAGIKGILERASVRKRVAKIKPSRRADHPASPQAHLARKALSIAAGVALAVGGWMFLQRTSSNKTGGIIAENLPSTPSSQEVTQKPTLAITEAEPAQPATDLPDRPSASGAQTDTSGPVVQQIDSSSPSPNTSKTAVSPSDNPDLTSKEKPPSEQVVSDVPPASLPNSSKQSQRVLPAQREQGTKARRQLTAPASAPSPENKLAESKPVEAKPAESKPSESRPVQVVPRLPTPNSNKDANAPPPNLNSNPPQPATAAPVDIEKEKLAVALKQPAPPAVARTPVVTVSFDPFPSIRMPKAENSKKSHEGKSLQMGRLLTRVDPTYPEEAKQQGVEGTVKVHAIFNREGAVQSVIQVSGPPMLAPAAMNAVRQWHYSQTILGGQPMETEEDVTVLFRLADSVSRN